MHGKNKHTVITSNWQKHRIQVAAIANDALITYVHFAHNLRLVTRI